MRSRMVSVLFRALSVFDVFPPMFVPTLGVLTKFDREGLLGDPYLRCIPVCLVSRVHGAVGILKILFLTKGGHLGGEGKVGVIFFNLAKILRPNFKKLGAGIPGGKAAYLRCIRVSR